MNATLRAPIVAIALVLAASAPALAHKEKLPKDALTLVRQASAILAKDRKMAGEARERLDAALLSSDPRGVRMEFVHEARAALEAGRVEEARRLLARALLPAPAPRPAKPKGASGPATSVPPPPAPRPQTTEERMRMDQALAPRYTGSAPEIGTAAAGVALLVAGLLGLRREAVRR